MMHNRWTPKATVLITVLVALAFIIACGGSATATTAPAVQPTLAPGATAAAVPTPTPAPAATPVVTAMVTPTGTLNIAAEDLREFGFQPRLSGGATGHVWRTLGERLVFVNAKKEYVPYLAKEWSISSDGLVWTFKLRKGVQFHQGYGEMTAEDVIWTFQEMGREDSRQSFRDHINRLWNLGEDGKPNATAVDDYTIELNSGTLQADMLNVMSRPHINIFSKKVQDELGEEGAFQKGVGTSPWEKVEIKPGQFWKFRAVEDHWRKTPYFAEYVMWHMPEESTRVANFLVGKLDTFEMALDSIPVIEKQEGTKFMRVPDAAALSFSLFGNWYVGHGTPEHKEKSPGYDPSLPWVSSSPDIDSEEWKNAAKVRIALNIAIDRQSIVDTILMGEGKPAVMQGWGCCSHRLPSELRQWEYNPERAKQLLTEAGYADGFSIVLKVPPLGIPGAEDAVQAVALMWEDIGVRGRTEAEVYVTLRPKLVGRIYDAAYFNGGGGRPDPLDLWPEVMLSTAGFTFGMNHPVMDELLNKAIGIPDTDARYVVMVEAARFAYENALQSSLYTVNRIWPLGPRIDTWLEHVNYSSPGDLTNTTWIPHRK